jgi:phage terminase Nu1 subunit (DNA packaging protein)
MADLLTVHWRTVENYEKKTTPWSSMDKIAEVTGTSVQWLLHGKNTVELEDGDRLERIENLLMEIRSALAQEDPLEGSERLTEEQAKEGRTQRPAERGSAEGTAASEG